MKRSFIIVAWLLTFAASARCDGTYLDDGHVGRGNAASDRLVVTFADGISSEVDRAKAREIVSEREVNAAVDGIVNQLARGAKIEQVKERLQSYGPAAVPRLVEIIDQPDRARRLLALSCLQYCWSPAARGPVLAQLRGPDELARTVALSALRLGERGEELGRLLAPLAEEADPAIVRLILRDLELSMPDAARMKRLLGRKELWPDLAPWLPRYQTPDLSSVMSELLRKGDGRTKAWAIVALLYQNDDSEPTRRLVAEQLATGDAVVRDRAAEYFAWHGSSMEAPALREAMSKEQDPYSRASMQGAFAAIERRAARFKDSNEQAELVVKTDDVAPRYREAASALRRYPTTGMRTTVMALYRKAEVEPVWRHGRDGAGDSEAAGRARMELARMLFAAPRPVAMADSTKGKRQDDKSALPIAKSWMAPVREYFDVGRDNFGKHIAPGSGPFSGLVHVGEDVAWEQDQETVVAAAEGVVRHAQALGDWGMLVVVEHRLSDGSSCCSLYGHLAPLPAVAVGETVAKGQKLGAIARRYTHENGGFLAHLHFGIHLGPYDDEEGEVDWIAGYIEPTEFAKNQAGWVDPQPFIRQRMTAKSDKSSGP